MPPAAKDALTYLFVQAEFGLLCPVNMTDSLTRTLKRHGAPALVARFIDRLTSLDLDTLAQGAMFMTEQGAGSDIAATTTRAEQRADGTQDGTWRLTGDKWFCSNPDAELALVLARSDAEPGLSGISLFLLPKLRRDGGPNAYRRKGDLDWALADLSTALRIEPTYGYAKATGEPMGVILHNVVGLLHVAGKEQVELLVGASHLHIGADGHRVVALEQWVEQLENRNRLARGVALGEVVALEQLGDRGRAGQAEEIVHWHREPL